jgi:hypothetical protein
MFCCHSFSVTLYNLNKVDGAYIHFCANKDISDDLIAQMHLLLDVIAVTDGFVSFEEADKWHVLLAIENITT